MDLDILWKAIVPLTFLAIWALTALFNRDTKALPPRTQSSNNPYGLRPTPPPAPPRSATIERSPTIRWAAPGGGVSSAQKGGLDDDIVILDSPRTGRSGASKGVSPTRRSKPRPVQASKPNQSATARGGLAGVSQSVNQSIATTLTLQPLSETSIATPVQSVTAATAATSIDVGDVKSGLAGVANAFSDPKRLREAIIVSVILQPPVSLRGRSRRI
jgi:hypothetical protein